THESSGSRASVRTNAPLRLALLTTTSMDSPSSVRSSATASSGTRVPQRCSITCMLALMDWLLASCRRVVASVDAPCDELRRGTMHSVAASCCRTKPDSRVGATPDGRLAYRDDDVVTIE